jgi:hypothetical protein
VIVDFTTRKENLQCYQIFIVVERVQSSNQDLQIFGEGDFKLRSNTILSNLLSRICFVVATFLLTVQKKESFEISRNESTRRLLAKKSNEKMGGVAA